MNLCTTDRQAGCNLLTIRQIIAGCEIYVMQRSRGCTDTVKQFIRNHEEVFDWGRLEDVCMNAQNDGHLCDTKVGMSHSRGDSACRESQWHHPAISHMDFRNTHTYTFTSWQKQELTKKRLCPVVFQTYLWIKTAKLAWCSSRMLGTRPSVPTHHAWGSRLPINQASGFSPFISDSVRLSTSSSLQTARWGRSTV